MPAFKYFSVDPNDIKGMLKSILTYFSFLLLLLLSIGCSSSDELTRKALFPFEYEDEEYQIVSIVDRYGDGMNLLLQMEQDSSVFRSLDRDQDGIIDLIQFGPLTLEEANLIYTYGIQLAKQRGKFRGRERPRLFEFQEEPYRYTIQTLGSHPEVAYNRFCILDYRTNLEESYLDLNADGILDQTEFSERDLSEVQIRYQQILKNGMNQSLIHFKFNKYLVKDLVPDYPI